MVEVVKKKYSVRVGVEVVDEYLALGSLGAGDSSEC